MGFLTNEVTSQDHQLLFNLICKVVGHAEGYRYMARRAQTTPKVIEVAANTVGHGNLVMFLENWAVVAEKYKIDDLPALVDHLCRATPIHEKGRKNRWWHEGPVYDD